MENKSIETIINNWENEGVKLSPPSNLVSIKAAEEVLGFQFPSDFKEFYLKHDGFLDWDMTSENMSIWPLFRILEVYHNENNNNFIVFADFLNANIECNEHHFGFIKEKNGIYKFYYDDSEPELIAESFTEFINLIYNEDGILY